MAEAEFRVTRLVDGLGFGVGTISGGADSAPFEILQKVDETIERDPSILIPIDADENGEPVDDDGCGDGRDVKLITRGTQVLGRSLNRAKVFGGGLVMGVAARIGLSKTGNKQLNELFPEVADEFDERHVNYGAHTDDHAQGQMSGCGAIDRAPETIANVVAFEPQIRGAIDALGADMSGLDEVFTGYKAYNEVIDGQPFSGADASHVIRARSKVIKQLAGDHQEKRILLNTVPGMTVNQALIRQVTAGQAQIFATDVWRLEEIARKLSDGDAALQNKIFLSGLVYTLSVAATLTSGDLPVYVTITR